MEVQNFVSRTSSIMLGMDGLSSTSAMHDDASNAPLADWVIQLEDEVSAILQTLLGYSDFAKKYDIASFDSPMIYVHTEMADKCIYMYRMETFAAVKSGAANRQTDELVYASLFEAVIEKYTKSNQKPNPVLRDTRSSDFCYRLAVKVEAVPTNNILFPEHLLLLREFLVLQHLWECYLREMKTGRRGLEQMIGFPMPFEFNNILGHTNYDFTEQQLQTCKHFDLHGIPEVIAQVQVPSAEKNSTGTIGSSMSYMSMEKLGPNLGYLVDLMRTQLKAFTISSALKVYDQILCRLMVMHKCGVVHCDLNPSSLFFGSGENCNVLYISEFSSSIVKPELKGHVPRFHDRFVSHLRFREWKCHFVQDIESAFYILFYLLLGRLPWDSKIASSRPTISATMSIESMTDIGTPTENGCTNKSVTMEEKEKFWNNQDMYNRAILMVNFEFDDSLYRSFSTDLLESLYVKTKEILISYSGMSPTSYVKQVMTTGSPVYNIYFGLRKIMATYFRFETLSPTLSDALANSRIEMLRKNGSGEDKRIAWDLSHWCWNHLDSKQNQAPGRVKLSVTRAA